MNNERIATPRALVALVLPPPARQQLIAAAEIEPHLPVGESPQRTRALESAIERVKRQHPNHFR